MKTRSQNLTQEDIKFLNNWDNHTDDHEFNYISNQYSLAQIWLKSVRKCKCKLDETSDDCTHIRSALKKLHGKIINKKFNEDLRKNFTKYAKTMGFKIPYKLQNGLSG